MSAPTKIEWSDFTWNPVSGCTKVSAGCDHCYAESIATRFAGGPAYPHGFAVTLKPERLTDPLRKRSWRGRRVFVNSMSDLFHKDVPDEYIARVFAVMALTPEITYQVLTKRHGRMRSLLNDVGWRASVGSAMLHIDVDAAQALFRSGPYALSDGWTRSLWPLLNVHLGVSVEDQHSAGLRIPALLDTPAAVRFLSCEPLLGRVDLSPWLHTTECLTTDDPPWCVCHVGMTDPFDWVIVGGETGPGARPMREEWAVSLVAQCRAANVPVFVKQMGSVWAKEHGLRGKADALDELPEGLRVREFPGGAS